MFRMKQYVFKKAFQMQRERDGERANVDEEHPNTRLLLANRADSISAFLIADPSVSRHRHRAEPNLPGPPGYFTDWRCVQTLGEALSDSTRFSIPRLYNLVAATEVVEGG